MKNLTTYTNEEVVAALSKYHAGRVPFDVNGKRFKVWPSLRLENDGGWTVLIEELPKPVVARPENCGRVRAVVLRVLSSIIRKLGGAHVA